MSDTKPGKNQTSFFTLSLWVECFKLSCSFKPSQSCISVLVLLSEAYVMFLVCFSHLLLC